MGLEGCQHEVGVESIAGWYVMNHPSADVKRHILIGGELAPQ
jgi:hypothetical protein